MRFYSVLCSLFFSLIFFINLSAQSYKILESKNDHITLEFNFSNDYLLVDTLINGDKYQLIRGKEIDYRKPGQPRLPEVHLQIGIPHYSNPSFKILNITQQKFQNKFIIPTPDSLNQPFSWLNYDQAIYNSNNLFPQSPIIIDDYIVRYAHVAGISISPYQYNPVSRELIFNTSIKVRIEFGKIFPGLTSSVQDPMTDNFLRTNVINYKFAKDWIEIEPRKESPTAGTGYWYNPDKDYFKIYLKKKGVYRITYDMLINSGVPPNGGIQDMNLELFNEGNSIPIDVIDVDSNGVFNSGDYFQFVGGPPSPADAYTRMNIYNLSNVYWFSYQADSLNYYKYKNGFPAGSSPFITSTIETLRWEKDLIYNQLGHANNDKRDYWYWGYAEARNRAPFHDFIYWIQDSIAYRRNPNIADAKIRVGLHGLTTASCNPPNGHSATIKLNTKTLGVQKWNGQEADLFEKSFYLGTVSSGDTIRINADQQKFEIITYGDICDTSQSDFILVDYVELDYWRWNRTFPNYYFFTSPPNNFNDNKYYLFNWNRDNMKIYIPSRGKLIANPFISNDQDKSVTFLDTISTQTDYYCIANDYFQSPDSIKHNLNPSDLRDPDNGADYIIIYHPSFQSAAEQLADFRSSNLSGYSNPRIMIVDIFDIYNEFSNGLLDPFALNEFAKYTFENWQSPAPAFMVLMGDMSHDYRKVFPTSRPNFIPSIPFHGTEFGQLPSDNSIVMVAGNDKKPDIAIGRLPCETLDEANILLDKIFNYPIDNSKHWKQNAILLASGLSYEDQLRLRFNDYAKLLETDILIPNGIHATKVFNFPEPQDTAFYGSGPRMREEINRGATVVSYYGHGGGAQWDLIFTKDDIPELTNGDRLPFISSITCYTAHFDNSESFGEDFVKIPNKGAIGFWGSVSLTWWPTGANMNYNLFYKLYAIKNHVIGDAILSTLNSPGFDAMIPQIVYLGDPGLELDIPKLPDFTINSSDISISPENPLKGDTVLVNININNLGTSFPNDSVIVELYKNSQDTSNLIGEMKLGNFGEETSVTMQWVPQTSGLFTLIARVNEKDIIEEPDHSDNIASRAFTVFDFGRPNIVKPVNGYFSNNDTIDFVISDIGIYFNRNLNYLIQINDTQNFDSTSVLIESPVLNPVEGIVRWKISSLNLGEYFWRVIVYDPLDTNTSSLKTFSIKNNNSHGYLAENKQLKLFNLQNIVYSDSLHSLILNTELKPPHPDENFFQDSIMYNLSSDSTKPAIFTTDGTYFYYGCVPNYNGGNRSKVYKIGTGLNGTIAGQSYGSIPNLSVIISSSLMYYSGYLYTNIGEVNKLLRIDPQSGDTVSVPVNDSLLITLSSATQVGGVFLYSDGIYAYNLAIGTSKYPNKFVLRKFDPSNNWEKIGEDVVFNGTIIQRVISFFVVDGYLIVYENYNHIDLRRYRLSDGVFEEQWRYNTFQKDYFAITYDHENNLVYFNTFRPGSTPYSPGFFKYSGTYKDAHGEIISQDIGPASEWFDLNFNLDQTNSEGTYKAYLLGKNITSGIWETIDTLSQPNILLNDVDAKKYDYLKLDFSLVDSSFGTSEPMKFNSLQVNYEYLPEISMIPSDMTFTPDSTDRGLDVNMKLKVRNIGYITADTVKIDFYENEGDSVLFSKYISLQPDSDKTVENNISTDNVVFDTKIKAVAKSFPEEYFTFNNLIENSFYVIRDTIRPKFDITFDGQNIINGDIVSANPEVIITLEDNSPLPLDTSYFTLVHTDTSGTKILHFSDPDLQYSYNPYPNSKATIIWHPKLYNEEHTLEILAKDASGNFFDSTSYRINFNVFSEDDINQVYNYPNPFKDITHFTFQLQGQLPEEFLIKVYTVAGRLIRDIYIQSSALRLGFNKYYWDGRDQDGDQIANGVYLYKVIAKFPDKTKTVTQKLAKVK